MTSATMYVLKLPNGGFYSKRDKNSPQIVNDLGKANFYNTVTGAESALIHMSEFGSDRFRDMSEWEIYPLTVTVGSPLPISTKVAAARAANVAANIKFNR